MDTDTTSTRTPITTRRLRLVRRLAAGALLVVPSVVTVAAPPAHAAASQRSVTFSSTGSGQSWTVPEGVHAVQAVDDGGQGAAGDGASGLGAGGTGGAAAEVLTTFRTTPGESLAIDVGSAGQATAGQGYAGRGGWSS